MNIILLMDENFHKNKLRIKKIIYKEDDFHGSNFPCSFFPVDIFGRYFSRGKLAEETLFQGHFS